MELLGSRKFHLWEGAFENAHDSWVNAHLLKGHALMKRGQAGRSAEALPRCARISRKPRSRQAIPGGPLAAILYYVGEAEAALGHKDAARTAWESALAEVRRGRVRVTTESAELDFHRALAMRKLGEDSRAQAVFQQIISTGENMVRRGPEVDEFAKFGERVSRNVSDARGHYIAGLGYMGIGNSAKARAEFDQALKLDVNQMWAKFTRPYGHSMKYVAPSRPPSLAADRCRGVACSYSKAFMAMLAKILVACRRSSDPS